MGKVDHSSYMQMASIPLGSLILAANQTNTGGFWSVDAGRKRSHKICTLVRGGGGMFVGWYFQFNTLARVLRGHASRLCGAVGEWVVGRGVRGWCRGALGGGLFCRFCG